MLFTDMRQILKSVLITCVIVSAVFLLPVKNVYAVANLNLSTNFQSVDGTRAYMDSAGTWDTVNNREATNNNPFAVAGFPDGGDTFQLIIDNVAGTGNVNRAFDLAISVDLPVTNEIRLPQLNNFPVPVGATSISGGSTCSALNNVRASQAGKTVNFSFGALDIISPDCRYVFNLGLTTNNVVSYGVACDPADAACDVRFNIAYNEVNNTPPLQNRSITHQADVNAGVLSLNKSGNTLLAVDGTAVNYDIDIENQGDGGLFNVTLTDTDSIHFLLGQLTIAPPFVPPDTQPAPGANTYTFNYLSANQLTTVVASGLADINPDALSCNILNSAGVIDRTGVVTASDSGSILYDVSNLLTIDHDASSYCELCGQGEVFIDVTNIGGITLNNVTVTEDLNQSVLGSGLSVVTGSVEYNGVSVVDPSPGAGGTFIFNLGSMDSPADGTPSIPPTDTIRIRFLVERTAGDEQGLANIDPADTPTTDLTVEATATFTSVCGGNPAIITTGPDTLLLRQPNPVVTKTGWNTDAGQTLGTAGPFVYGHDSDRVIWEVSVQNSGNADLEDLLIADTIGGNFDFTAVCENEPDATATAATLNAAVMQGTCVARSGLTPSTFAPPTAPDIAFGATANYYYVGVIQGGCSNATNTSDVQWGCEGEGAAGGVNASNSNIPAVNILDTADLNTSVSTFADLDPTVTDQLVINVQFTGTHPTNFGAQAEPAGSRGRVTVTITNDTGGTVRDIQLDNVLPPNIYVVDPTIDDVSATATLTTNNPQFDITMTPANGVASYPGMIDEVTWTNPVVIGDPVTDPLLNIAPHFTFTSSSPGLGPFPDHMLRHGDVLTLSFDVVLIDPTRYDLLADLDVREEIPLLTDPDNNAPTGFDITNSLTVTYEESCSTPNRLSLPVINNTFQANPEDLDVDIVGGALNFILNSDPAETLPLTVRVTNNGGHSARNYFLYVSFGNAISVNELLSTAVTSGNCSTVAQPLARLTWDTPASIPNDATVYRCDTGAITPGLVDLDFIVNRNPASVDPNIIDDLTFRVDVVGEIQLSDGTPLIFPAVTPSPPAQIASSANNYSLDGVRARVIGFGLVKTLVPGSCTEEASYVRDPATVYIGEDCQYTVESGGWFGFLSPGFGQIAISNIQVFDELPTAASALPSAQGFISQDDGVNSDAEIIASGITFTAPTGVLGQGTVNWLFHQVDTNVADDNKLLLKDKTFIANIISRILNDSVDPPLAPVATPNRHNITSRNILNTTFDADFEDSAGNPGFVSFGPTTTGYPDVSLRLADLVITEPNLQIRKTVCNETLSGSPEDHQLPGISSCAPYLDDVSNGDTQDFYVFKIEIVNVDDSAGANPSRAPAYNVVVTDTFDSTDLMQVTPIPPGAENPLTYPFLEDDLDNDNDGVTDEADEALILNNNNVNVIPVDPAVLKFSYTHTTALEQIDPGETVTLYYRVDPDDFIAPLQILRNTVEVKYDSLSGLHGNQNVPQVDTDPDVDLNGVIGSARVHTDLPSEFPLQASTVQVLPLEVDQKIIVRTSAINGPEPMADLTNVVVGEEIEYRLRTSIPVANLRSFTVRDELPPGIQCVDVADVDLGPGGPHAAAQFVPGFPAGGNPGDVFTRVADNDFTSPGITCNENVVEWRFGDQELTAALGNNLFEFEVTFIARVENTSVTNVPGFDPALNNHCIIKNGGLAATQSRGQPYTPPNNSCNQDTYVATTYINSPSQGSSLIEHVFSAINVTVTEPILNITKTFTEVTTGNDETTGDAGDIFEVRIDIENTGDANAYIPEILDNLNNTKYTYLGNVSGPFIPFSDGVSFPLPLTAANLPPAGLPASNQPVFIGPAGYFIAPGAGNAISFSYQVQANGDVLPIEDLDNTANVKWASLDPAAITPLNSSGVIGADGSELGMRIGFFPGETTPDNIINDYNDDDTDSIAVPAIQFSKDDLNLPDNDITIGEHRRYQLEIRLPEGTTTDVSITDNIAFGDESYILENAGAFEVVYEFIDILSVNTLAPINGADGTVTGGSNAETIMLAAPVDETPNSVLWNIGTVVTVAEDDSPLNGARVVNPIIRITYFARANNDLVTNAVPDNDNLRNEATLQYTSGTPSTETITLSTANVAVIEPLLEVTKVANVTTADAGDTIQYTLTMNHHADSTSGAFDLNFVDTLPASVTFDSVLSFQINGIDVVPNAPFITGQQLTWGRGNAGNDDIDLPFGESLVLVYTVTVNDTVEPNELIQNSVVVDWTSLNGDITGLERIGIGGVDCSASVAPDDYCLDGIDDTVTVVDNNTIVKTIVTDTSIVPGDSDVRIGDIVTYALTITLQEGTTRSLTVTDTLPNGLEFIDANIDGFVDLTINGDSLAPYESANGFIHNPIPAIATPTGPGNNVLIINIGDGISGIVNNTANPANDFIITYRAVVTEAEFVLPQVATTSIDNTAVMNYVDVDGNPPSGLPLTRLTSTVNLDAQQPIIFTANLIKDSPDISSGAGVSSNQELDFRLLACNVGAGPAYDLTLVDNLPVEMNHLPTSLVNIDVDLTDPTGVTELTQLTDTVHYNYTAPVVDGGDMIFIFSDENTPLPANQCIRITYQINVDSPIGANLSWVNEFRLDSYASLDLNAVGPDVTERQDYVAAGPVFFSMNTITPNNPPLKSLQNPRNAVDANHDEATIGEIVTYQIIVPSDDDLPGVGLDPNPMVVDLFNVRIRERLDDNLTLVDIVIDESLPNTYRAASINDPAVTPVAGNEFDIRLENILDASSGAVEPVILTVRARVNNDAATNTTVTDINNRAQYFFTQAINDFGEIDGGSVTTVSADDISVVEPQINLLSKTVVNQTQANAATDAGDILLYTLTFSTSGVNASDVFSDAFDISIVDTLSAGLDFCSTTEDVNCIDPTSTVGTLDSDRTQIISGAGTTASPHIITWNSEDVSNNDIDIDVVEGTATVTIEYTVKVMNTVLAGQVLSSTTDLSYTSLDGDQGLNERTYNATFTNPPDITIPDTSNLDKLFNSTTSTLSVIPPDINVRVGDTIDYEMRIQAQEATHQNIVLSDALEQGLLFEGIVNVNIGGVIDNDGSFEARGPFSFDTFNQSSVVLGGDATTPAGSTVQLTLQNFVNAGNNDPNDDEIIITYRVRVLDQVLDPLVSNFDRDNNLQMVYGINGGTRTDITTPVTVNVDHPLITITKSRPVATAVVANEIITFNILITNSGQSDAYDLVLEDILPPGLRNGATPVDITSVEMPIGNVLGFEPVQDLTNLTATGQILWNFDIAGTANALTIPAGQSLQITYEVQADADIAAGLSVINQATATLYYSFDNEQVPLSVNAVTGITPATIITPPIIADREIYGPSNTDSVTVTTDGPDVLSKTVVGGLTDVSIGQPFRYRIQVPLIAVQNALHDVKITDNLSAIPNTDLIFLSVTAINDDASVTPDEDDTYNPVNSGTPTNLVIEDIVNGIEIPADRTITVELEVLLRDSPINSGLPLPAGTFSNIANYTFNSIDGDDLSVGNGVQGTAPAITIVEPSLIIRKTGPATPVAFNADIPYTIEVENAGTGPAFDTTITDILPNTADNPPLTGGTCNAIPANFFAQILRDDNSVVVPLLALGTDYTFTHTPETCALVITTLTPLAKIEDDEKLVISYTTRLDTDSMNGAQLTNNVSVTEYFSQDTPAGIKVGEIRRYENDVASLLDEASFTITVEAAELVITKIPTNLTTGGSGAFADPGDQLHYTINVQNIGPVATGIFSFTDEPDRLNLTPGYFDFSSITNVVVNSAIVPFTTVGGVLDIPNLSLLGGVNDSLTIEFDINLRSVITAGTIVVNQGEVNLTGFSPQPTDDPSIAAVPGIADPTETLIDAAPAFMVSKSSADITGDTNILRQGDTLRYTVLVKNIGLENVNNAYIRDLVPANTSYVTGSTTLNGLPVIDGVNGSSPLENQILINAPENVSPGILRADADINVTGNVATITFDVVVDTDVVDGTVISNQAYVGGLGAGSGPIAEQKSDNPVTSLVNDPTIDVVGNLPALDAQKTVSLVNDVTANGVIDSGDTLEYQIVVSNGGAVSATQVSLIDVIPANSLYVANSVSLNGVAVPDSEITTAPLTLRINSSDLGLPDQAANDGQITAGNEATILFRVTANGAVNSLISNQATIESNEIPEQLTDADANSTNGAQPTVVTIGVNSELQFTKEVFVVGGGVAVAGGELEYNLQVTNTGLADASNIILIDTIPANVSYTLNSTKLDGSTTFIGSGVTEPGVNLQVNYQLAKGVLEAGEKFSVSYRVVSDAGLSAGTPISNTATVDWTENPSATPLSATSSIEIGGAPGVGVIGGNIWHDITRTPVDQFTSVTDLNLANWTVQIYLNKPARSLFATTVTDANGLYQFKGLPTISSVSDSYELRMIPPGGSDTSASMGRAIEDPDHANSGTAGEMNLTGIVVLDGENISKQNLAVLPHGVVYDSVLRTPVAGAILNLVQANGNPVPSACLPAGSNQLSQQTLVSGFYRFDIQDQAAGCNITNYVIEINGVPTDYIAGTSSIIPPGKAGNLQIDVPACNDSSDDTILGNGDCDIQFAVTPPGVDVSVRTDSTALGAAGETQGTTYYLSKRVDTNGEVAFNNHIPLDPDLESAVLITKISSMVNVTRSQLVPYTITLRNTLPAPIYDLDIIDLFPLGFKYIAGSGRIKFGNGAFIKTEPVYNQGVIDDNGENRVPQTSLDEFVDLSGIVGVDNSQQYNDSARLLTWNDIGTLGANETVTLKLLLVVGSGVGEGEYVNRAIATNNLTSGAASGIASATVRVVPDPTFDCSDVIGKVFDDKNLNAYQDEGEEGIPNVRVLTAKGLEITGDAHGRFHLTCAVVPNPDRGSNFIIKLDERSLPSGYRLTTENPRVVRATRGKMVKFNFGAAIHRVVRLDMADAVFEENSTEMRPQWLPRLDILITELAKDPSLLRLSYLAENESESEVNDRLDAVKEEIENRWEELNCCYQLMIETEVFWRKGGPVGGEFDE